MKIKQLFFMFLALLFTSVLVKAQQNYTLSGYVRDIGSGETLLGASVYNADNKNQGTATNLYGFYSLTLPAGNYTIEVSFLGFDSQQVAVALNQNKMLNFDLRESAVIINEAITVTATRQDKNVNSTDMGRMDLSVEKIKSLPALGGEVDLIRAIQLMPGVKGSGDVSSGLYVRGGGPDQNLVLLDEAVVYNIGHLFGFFSVFNSDAIKSNTLYKGSMPAMYGGRLSSVLDVSMKDGNNKKYEVAGGIGNISSRLTIEGPIQKDKSSFIIAGRRTYADVLARPFLKGTDFEGNGYYFYDLNLKANYRFSDKDRIFLSGYFGRDVFNFKSTDGFSLKMPWGNSTATLRWNHLFSSKLFMNTTAVYNAYNFGADSRFNDFSSKFYSGVRDWNAKVDFDYFPAANHDIKFGANYTYHTFTPYTLEAVVGDTQINTDELNKQNAHEAALYIQDDFTISDKLKVHIGLRGSLFQQVGPYKTAVFNNDGIPADSVFYENGEPIVTYGGIEPRINLRYTLSPSKSLKGGVAVANQYIHLVSNSTALLPTDLWVPSTKMVKPQRGIQYSLGYFQNFKENTYEASVEVYYKSLKNQIEFSEDYYPELNALLENSFVFGQGRAYGVEFFLQKQRGKFTGWIGYTFSRTERSFPDINLGRTFPARYDRTHDLSVVAIYDVSQRWNLGATFVYNTGQAITLPNSFFMMEGWIYTEFDMPRNSYRMKPYHRLDFSATYRLNKKSDAKFKSDLNFSVYNVYSRLNPFFLYAVPEVSEGSAGTAGSIDIKLKQVSLFPIIPSITWNFKL
ncbi:TonB-dependent receptor [Sphingobacteriales bacterium UPWRP_1]|nr:TonB-dependent receptor [Sphingobacteriales bacterium TSM_CSS]PSJ72984.1 TonB-dependent receptor [Sphingobacteriales bacterium UPWRP_1]